MTRRFAFYYPRALHGDGGVTNSLWYWVDALSDAGADVSVLHDPRLPRHPSRRIPEHVRLVPVAHHGCGRLAISQGLNAAVDSTTTLVLHSGYVLFNLAAAERAHRWHVPYVAMPLGAYDPQVRRRGRRGVRAVWELGERRMLERAIGVHVFFEPEVGHVAQLAPRARTIVAPTPFPVPEAAWTPERSRGYVAWLGRYDVHHKGLDRLLDAMALLTPGERPVLRLHGRDHKHSRDLVRRMVDARGLAAHVEVGGAIDGEAKQDFLLNAAAYVHPARWESYGIALVESLALGVPCITTNDINLGPGLADAGAATVCEGSPAGLAAALGQVGSASGHVGREFVRTRLSSDVAAAQFLDGIDTVARQEAPL